MGVLIIWFSIMYVYYFDFDGNLLNRNFCVITLMMQIKNRVIIIIELCSIMFSLQIAIA
jgi:hypothetical protein